MQTRKYPVAIIGAGPVGLAAAAHLSERNIPFLVFEAGDSIGATIRQWQHVRLFSPWKYNIDAAAARLLDRRGWTPPPADALPTGQELVERYLIPLASLPPLAPFIHTRSRVVAIARKGVDKTKDRGRAGLPFVLRMEQEGSMKSVEASAVLDASGSWQNPNPIGMGGMPAIGEGEQQGRIFRGIPDIGGTHALRYANKSVLVVGGGHSAINSLLELARLKRRYPATTLHWSLLADQLSSVYGGKEKDQLPARGALGQRIEQLVQQGLLQVHTPFLIDTIRQEGEKVSLLGERKGTPYAISGIDEIIANTGARPDFSFSREVRVAYHEALECVPALAPLIDPNLHSCGTVRPHGEQELRQPEKDYYVVGVKSYGRAPTFLMTTGYEQVRSIAAYLAGDLEAARRVELNLPETGVCSSTIREEAVAPGCCGSPAPVAAREVVAASGCCGGAPASSGACCLQDEEAKAAGGEGCGCGTEEIHLKQQPAAFPSACCSPS